MSEALQRGFKSEAERTALTVRRELGLGAIDRLDCFALADYFGIPVVSLAHLASDGAAADSISRMLTAGSALSALTVCAGTRRLIVYNPAHASGRRANSLAHELSHVILEHPPRPALGRGGCRLWDARHEAEADWQ